MIEPALEENPVHELVYKACQTTFINAKQLLEDSLYLFNNGKYKTSTFCAMTSIEEIGKIIVLRMFGLTLDSVTDLQAKKKQISKVIINHTGKALEMADWSLFINESADRRHGIHPNGTRRTSGVVLLTRSKCWMELRNQCLYTDINLDSGSSNCNIIDRPYAYYFICMAYEGIITQSFLTPDCNGGDSMVFDEWGRLEKELAVFMSREHTDIDELNFLKNPDYYRKRFQD